MSKRKEQEEEQTERYTMHAGETRGGDIGCLNDPIAQDVDAGAASVQQIGPHCPARKEYVPPTRQQLGLCEEPPLQVIIDAGVLQISWTVDIGGPWDPCGSLGRWALETWGPCGPLDLWGTCGSVTMYCPRITWASCRPAQWCGGHNSCQTLWQAPAHCGCRSGNS